MFYSYDGSGLLRQYHAIAMHCNYFLAPPEVVTNLNITKGKTVASETHAIGEKHAKVNEILDQVRQDGNNGEVAI